MRMLWILLVCGLAGCATQRPPATAVLKPVATPPRALAPAIVTRYELGEYRYPRSPDDQQDTSIYRRTRVGLSAVAPTAGAMDRTALYSPSSYTPLPPSEELSAELAAQRLVTRELSAIKDSVVALEEKIRGQYGALVTRTEEVTKIQEQLEAERARVRDLETQLTHRFSAPANRSTPSPAPPAPIEGVKW